MTRSDSVKKVDIIKIIVNRGRRFIFYTVQNFGYIFEFTISVRKAWFSSLAYDPALRVRLKSAEMGFRSLLSYKKTGVPVGDCPEMTSSSKMQF